MFSVAAIAQEPNFCGTKAEKTAWFKQYIKNRENLQDRGKSTIYMPMTVSVLTNDDGSGSYDLSRVLDEICQLNVDYQQVGVYFYLDTLVRYIPNKAWNNHKDYTLSFEIYEKNRPKTINTYYGNDAAGNCGYDFPGTGIILRKSCMGPGSHTWAHEMGHELALPHTFFGWEGITYSTAKPTPLKVDDWPVELINKSNCKEAGDEFCDTPPDYLSYRWNCTSNSQTNFELTDPEGVKFRVDGTYFMSYPQDACMSKFSQEQIATMRENTMTEKLEMMKTSLDIKEIKDTAVFIYPLRNSSIKIEGEYVSWSKVANATNYYVEVSRGKSFAAYILKANTVDTFLLLPKLTAGNQYVWRVRPYNLTTTCKIDNKVRYNIFFTEAASNTLDVNDLANVEVFPNPSQAGNALNININANQEGNLNLSVFDLNGKAILQQKILVSEGENELSLSMPHLSAGVYLLQINAPIGSVQKKIVVY